MAGFVSIGTRQVPEVRLWALGGALGILTGIPAASAVAWIIPIPIGLLLVLTFLGVTWAVRRSSSPLLMRAWAVLAWAVLAGPMFLAVIALGGAVIPRATPDPIVGVIGLSLVVAGSAALASLTFVVGRRWFEPRIRD